MCLDKNVTYLTFMTQVFWFLSKRYYISNLTLYLLAMSQEKGGFTSAPEVTSNCGKTYS